MHSSERCRSEHPGQRVYATSQARVHREAGSVAQTFLFGTPPCPRNLPGQTTPRCTGQATPSARSTPEPPSTAFNSQNSPCKSPLAGELIRWLPFPPQPRRSASDHLGRSRSASERFGRSRSIGQLVLCPSAARPQFGAALRSSLADGPSYQGSRHASLVSGSVWILTPPPPPLLLVRSPRGGGHIVSSPYRLHSPPTLPPVRPPWGPPFTG